MKVTYQFSGFKLACDTITGDAYTHYPGGTCSPRPLVSDDSIHAEALGITPQQHAIAHELMHHLSTETPAKGCPIVYADAHGLDMPANAEILEWKITALTYMSYRKPMPQVQDWGAIMDLQKEGFDIYEVAERLQQLMQFKAIQGVRVIKDDAAAIEYDRHDNYLPNALKGHAG